LYMHRVLIPPDAIRGNTLTVTDAQQLHHLRVLRVKVGDRLEGFDGKGRVYAGTVARVGREAVTMAIEARREDAPPPVRILLAQALIKPTRFEWVLEKATELGVAEVLPVIAARSTARPATDRDGSRLSRWRRIVEAAATQCGRATLPLVHPPRSLGALLPSLDGRLALLATLSEHGASLRAYAEELTTAGDVVLLIGPEGDFSPEEVAQAIQQGAHPVRLGRLTLRSETAALAALAVLQYLSGSADSPLHG